MDTKFTKLLNSSYKERDQPKQSATFSKKTMLNVPLLNSLHYKLPIGSGFEGAVSLLKRPVKIKPEKTDSNFS